MLRGDDPNFGAGTGAGGGSGDAARRRRLWIIGGVALAVLILAPALALALTAGDSSPQAGHGGGNAPHGSTTTTAVTTTSTTTTTTTTAPPTTTLAPAPSSTTTTAPPVATGRVTRAGGAPVKGAFVVGLRDLSVAGTNAKGEFTVRCTGQPLMYSPWLVPIASSGGAAGNAATRRIPASGGPGYIFSGGSTTASGAGPVACGGKPVETRLPLGATVDIVLLTSTGGPYPSAQGAPDTFSLPGLGAQGLPMQASASAAGVQTLAQLGAGTLGITVTSGHFTCSGGGVTPFNAPAASLTVNAVAGRTVVVRCKVAAA